MRRFYTEICKFTIFDILYILCYSEFNKDRCAKILFGKKQNLDITTLLISSILKVDYDKLEGKIKFLPLSNPKDRKKSKKTEKDIVLLVEVDGKNQLMVLEFNYFRKDLENMFKNTLEDADKEN